MAISTTNVVRDGIRSVRGGIDSTTNPSDLETNTLSFAVNIRTRGGFVQPRPGYKKKKLNLTPKTTRTTSDFTVPSSGSTVSVSVESTRGLEQDQHVEVGNSGRLKIISIDDANSTITLENQGDGNAGNTIQSALGVGDADIKENFQNNLFQGATVYDGRNGESKIVASIGGRLFCIEPLEDFRVSDISIAGDLNSSQQPEAWFAQAEEFLVVQDGLDTPLIFDGSSTRRSRPFEAKEIPVGRQMAYGQGRLWVVRNDKRSFTAGDLVYSQGRRSDVLKFTENTFLNEGGSFAVPETAGDIRGLSFISALDTSLGQGPLQIFTTRQIFNVNAPVDRTTWKDLRQPLQTVSLKGAGGMSQKSLVSVNNDVWFRSHDGMRSYKQAARDFSRWGNTPLSSEVERVLADDEERLLEFSSGALFDNRLLMTVSPKRDFNHGVHHKGLIALDFNPVSGMKSLNEQPVYDGLWTGVEILQVIRGEFAKEERCFAFVLNSSNQIELWEITRDDRFDEGDTRIEWQIEGSSLGFNDGGNDEKYLDGGDVFIDRLGGTVDFTAYFRPDQYPGWITWHAWQECATVENCDPCSLDQFREQYRPRMGLPQPPNNVSDPIGRRLRLGFEFQPRLVVTGFCRLKMLRMKAYKTTEPEDAPLRESEAACTELAQCPIDPYTYSV